MTDRRLRAGVVTGVLAPRDAISAIARQQADALARTGPGGPAADVRIFCQHDGTADPRAVVLPADPRALAADDWFRACDLLVFNFGIAYPLFDALPAAPRAARVVGCYFGVTPPHLLPPGCRDPARRAYQQLANLHAADRVLVTGDFVRDDLLRLGLPADRVHTVYPAVGVVPAARPARRSPGPLRLLYVGRFVPAKGVRELVQAAARAVAAGVDLRLELAGGRLFSDADYLAELDGLLAGPLLGRATLALDLCDAELAERYAGADAVVLPSRHEGFGVPAAEALAAGCPVLHADGSALAETVGGLGRSFPAGDVDVLAERLGELAAAVAHGTVPTDAGPVPLADWRDRAAGRAAGFGVGAFEERFRAAALGGLVPLRTDARDQLLDAHRRASAPPVAGPPVGHVSNSPAPAGQSGTAPHAPAGLVAPPAGPLPAVRRAVRRVRPAVHRVPVVGTLLRYVKRCLVLPWNFHKHYQRSAAFQAEVLAALPHVAAEARRLAEAADRPPPPADPAQAELLRELAAELARLRDRAGDPPASRQVA